MIPKCKVCDMKPGKALINLLQGYPDFVGDSHCSTMSYSSKAKLVDCLKCTKCGRSVTK